MANRSTLPARIVVTGSRTLAERYVAYGRVLLGSAMEIVESSLIESHTITRRIGDVTVSAYYAFDAAIIKIDVPFNARTEAFNAPVKPEVWVPRGFVLYPISDTSVNGWGAPVILGTDNNPYSDYNLRPGLDTSRWTAGGALGEVLLTTIPDAGYPENESESLTAPMLYHTVYGLRPQEDLPDRTGTWAAYRLEFEDYTAQSPDASEALLAAARSFKRDIFEYTNAYRATFPGRTPLLLPIRGRYDSAQATAEVMAASGTIGHESPDYAPTYNWLDDRGSKDGIGVTGRFSFGTPAQVNARGYTLSVGENLIANPSGPVTVIGTDYVGLPIYSAAAGPTLNAVDAFALWEASPEHSANMRDTAYNTSDATSGYTPATSLYVGYKSAYYAQHLSTRHHWVPAGNMTWHPADSNIPIVSWDGFNSLNLAWETWPVRFLPDFDMFTSQVYKFTDFTLPVVASGAEQLTIIRTDLPLDDNDRRARLNLSPRVYMRGRAIAVAPDGALVWAAAVQRRPDVAGIPVYRLVILAHHSADQAAQPAYPSALTDGVTSVLRVWYVDIPQLLPEFVANAETVIRGVYGVPNPDGPWDWDDINSPYSWRGGVAVNVSDSTTLLKYASQWRFSPDGTKAVCLRDYGSVSDLEEEYMYQSDPPGAALGPTIDAMRPMSGQLSVMTGARWVKYVELDVSDATSPSLFVSAVNAGATPHKPATTYSAASTGGITPAVWVRPAAVDYDTSGNLIFAHHVIGFFPGAYAHATDPTATLSQQRHGIYFSSDWDVTWPTAAPSATWYSATVAMPDTDLMGALASVINVRDKVWAHIGAPCSATDTGPVASDHPDYPLYVSDSPDVMYRTYDFTAECAACGQIPASHTLRMYRNGVMILDTTAANSNGIVHDFRLFPNTDHRFVPFYLNPALQASYARDETGAWVATLAHIPQVGAGFRFTPSGSPSTETTYWGAGAMGGENQCFNDCGEGWKTATRPATSFAHVRNLGGKMTSSFAPGSALTDLMQVPGSNPRSPYVRVV